MPNECPLIEICKHFEKTKKRQNLKINYIFRQAKQK